MEPASDALTSHCANAAGGRAATTAAAEATTSMHTTVRRTERMSDITVIEVCARLPGLITIVKYMFCLFVCKMFDLEKKEKGGDEV